MGTTYGGDGRVAFNLPDLRGRVSVGNGTGPRLQNYPTGMRGGSEFTTQSGLTSATNVMLAAGSSVAVEKAPEGADPKATVNVPSGYVNGAGQPHDNRQPFVALTACLVLYGSYPPRD